MISLYFHLKTKVSLRSFNSFFFPNLNLSSSSLVITRNVEAFLRETATVYRPNPSEKAKFWWDAIAVFFKNASALRVPYESQYHSWGGEEPFPMHFAPVAAEGPQQALVCRSDNE